MSFCVNIKSKQFKDTAARLGISEGQLELIAHKYGNSEGTYGQFPSDNYIMRQVVGRPELNADENIVRIWHERYQNAQTFTTAEELNDAKTEALRFFEESSIGTTTLPDGRLQMIVAEPNSTEEPLISYMSNNAEQVIDGKLGVNKEQLISLLGSTMYKGNVQSVAVKELLQNAFDAVKIAQSQGKIQGKAKIRVNLDAAERTVTISDNGTGMSPEIVQKAFFTIGGSYKGENVDNRLKSGGLGLAKMAFLFSSEYVEVSTVKDGIKTYVNTNPEQIQNDNFKITTSRTNEPNGTTVTVKIPESYLDENGEKRSIWFDTSPNFLSKPMIGNVDVEVTKKPIWGTETTTTYDKNVIPEGYTPIGKATSDFGDIEMYVAPADSGDITAEVLISGLHQFTKWFSVKGATKGRFKVILNILPTVGVKSAVYPINNQREGFRATIEPEVKDIGYLLNQINRSLEKKSIAATFGSAMSMDVGKIAEVKREASNTDTLNSAVKEVLGQLATKQKTILGIPVGKTQENSLDLKSIRTQRETAEKSRNSSLNTSGINYDRNSSVSSVDTSGLDITKPLFHNNTTMVIGEDGQAVLNELGKLMMELKSLYVQTYKNAGIQSRFGDVIDHISKQFWGISFDKGYGGVNVNPSIINLLAINPFYQVQTYPGVDTALALTEYLTHLIIHEFNHNYAGGEGAGFTGRFPATYAEFAGIGKQFNKEWKNKLYTLIRDNLDTFIKYNKEYEKATNLGESFESDRITAREESQSSSTENDGKDLFWNRSGEDVYENGERNRQKLLDKDSILKNLQDTLKKEEHLSKRSWLNATFDESSGILTISSYDSGADWDSTAYYKITDSGEVAVSSDKINFNTNPNISLAIKEALQALIPQQDIGSKQFVNHSGGAIGSDSYWGTVGERYGVKSNHYYHGRKTPAGNVEITEEQFNEGKQKVLQANRTLNRQPDRYMDLLARNWMQVKNSDSVFAIGHLKKGIVDGGTGWAVQMAIDAGKPVYVFDQERGEWFKNIGGQWSRSDVPTLTPNFAGIGTRQLNDSGRRAIEAVYEKTFTQQQSSQQNLAQQVTTQGTTQQYGVVIDRQLKSNYAQWQQQNPNGIVAYRINFNRYNTPEEAAAGRIGNPFSEGQGQTNKGVDTVQKFFEWLTTGNNFGEAKATEEYRQAIIQKLLNTPVGTPILYYTELGRPSHATILGYLINHKELLGGQQREQDNTLEVSTAGDAFGKQFSAFNAKFKQGTIIDGVDVSGRSIEDVYQNVIKQSGKNMPPATFSRLQTLYRGYATKTEAKAKDLDETVGNTAADYVEGIAGFIPKYHFTSLREEAEGYASTRTDRSEEEFIRDGEVVRQQNRHYTGDFAQVGSYYISKDAKVVTFEDLHDLNRNPQRAENADIIVLKRGTLDQRASEFIVREGGKHLIKELSEVSKDTQEEYSYQEGYLPLWQEWARQNPELIEQLRKRAEGKTLTDKFAHGAVSQARALTEILAQRQEVQQQEQAEVPKVEETFHKKSTGLVGQINNLLNSGLMATEVREEANKLMDWISDQLTQYLEDPSIVWDKYFADTQDSSQREGMIDRISKMSRQELLELIGVDRILEIYSNEVLSRTEENAETFDSFDDDVFDKLDLIKENMKGLVQLGYSRFSNREEFSIVLSEDENSTYSTNEKQDSREQLNPDDTNGENDPDRNSEEEGNQQEHWQIESRTREILDNASAQIKQALSDCLVLVDNGKRKEDGTPDYDIQTDDLGRNERVTQLNATRSIVKWTQGALSLQGMIDMLSSKEKENPWISQIITRLKDTSGNESDFQNEFFTVFSKHFQPYSIVIRDADGTFHTSQVNAHPALDDAMTAIKVQYRLGKLPLFNSNGVDTRNLEGLREVNNKLNALGQLSENNRKEAVTLVGKILTTVGFPQSEDSINRVLTDEIKNTILTAVSNMAIKLDNAAKEKSYDPFKFKDNPNGITGYVQSILRPFTEALEDVMVSSIFDSGKMYQSYITPSWTTKLFKKMHLDNKNFHKFLLNEFATSEWFIDGNANLLAEVSSDRLVKMSDAEKEDAKAEYIGNHPEIWRTPWLRELVQMDEKARMETFVHRVQLNFNKSNYMRGMTDLEYALSVFTEFYADGSKNYKGKKFAYYRLPMLSNKPSNEFIRFTRYSGATALAEITDGFLSIFNQEMSRIQTVRMLELNKADKGYIEYFNERGKEFQFLDYLNDYLVGEKKNTVLGELLNNKLDGKIIDESALTPLVEKEIRNHLVEKGDALVAQYRNNGLFEALKNIENVGTSDAAVETAIREFAWNDMFAQANILELLITDKAYYKNEEDLQKRLAQVHSPGIRGNWDAIDYDGNRVSDGKLRIVKISDFAGKDVIINTLANLEEVFDKKIEEAEDSLKDQWRALKESIITAYKKVNVVDGQAFVSPTAYRKKAIAFGEWSREAENTYKELMQGKFNLASLKSVFNPRKPFTYGKVNKNISEMTGIDTPIKTLNYGVQYKDSEYLLIMADALLRGQETSRPNLLGALFDVMEESAKTNPAAGIDFIVFESGVKTGISGAISISDLVDNPDGRDIAFNRIWRRIINTDGSYNQAYVDTLNAEDYANQQTVPEHFMGHGGLQWGSQVRVIMPSDLEVSYLGQPVEYEFYDDATKEWKKLDKEGIRKEWDNTTAEIINDGINTLKTEFGLNNSEYSQADRNIILSKILQREILSNARYGVDLLLACSVDENGNFRIPLGDPIQSKRVEQLINSIIKNRINKIKVEGGTLVEVTNFGVSKRLERRYKDKNGNLLKAKRDYLAEGHTEAEFNQYVKENQAGIAYDECYAPAWAREIFENFADEKGNIDVEAIEMLDADLLKMFGYRIPTEDKYSCAPYKIVGFLPKEAGDGFMQPWETTVTDGSDFDVDKKNLMRMVINIKKKIMSKSEFAKANKITNEEELDNKYSKYRKDNNPSPANILKKIGDSGRIKLSATEKAELDAEEERIRKRKTDKAKSLKDNKDNSAVESYNRKYAERVESLEKEYNTLSEKEDLTEKEERDMLKLDRKIEREVAKLDRELEGKKAENETEYNKRVEEIESELSEIRKDNEARLLNDRKLSIIRKILDEGVFRDSSTVPTNERGVFLAVKRAYLDMMFEASKPTEGKDYLNNKIFNMQWAIATHASTADKMLNPGNFDPQKSMGYKVAAFRLGNHTWEELNAMSIDALKYIVFTSKNLMEFDVQTQFYKQNSVAGQILGIFAVAKSAHAMFEGRNYGILVEDNFTIAGMDFGGIMSLDKMKDRSGVTLIGKTLGSLVSASADAVKDPVLNFMNINKETVNVLNAALRLGMDFDSISLLLSTKTISDILSTYYRSNLSKKVSLKNVIAQKIRELEADPTIGKNSPLAKQELTTKEMIDAIRKDNPNVQYKILKAFQRLSNIADTINPLTNISRLNSVASAVGPQHIDSIMSKNKLDASFKNIVKIGQNGLYEEIIRDDVFQDIPSLRAFYEAYNIVFGDSDNAGLFKQLGITTASEQFNEVLNAIPGDMKFLLMNNKKLLSSLGDFFQSYLLVQSDVASVSQKERYIKNFAKWFTEQGFKSKYPNNPFIQAIQTDVVSKEGHEDKYYLKIETTGMEQSEKDALSAGWIQLEKENPDLSHWLFFYNFWRGGIGFSPKTFMGLVPLQVKEKIGGYLNTYRNLPTINGSTVFDQWVRNNWNNDSLVTRVSRISVSGDGKMLLAKGRNYYKVAGSPYVKMNVDGRDVLFRRTSFSTEYKFAEYEQITPLGNNGEYFEAFPFEDTVKPSAVPNTVDRGTLVSDQLETTEDNLNDVVRTQEEMEQDLVDFIDVLRGDEGRTTELGEAEMEEKFDELTKDLGLSEDKAKFDDIMDNFCR